MGNMIANFLIRMFPIKLKRIPTRVPGNKGQMKMVFLVRTDLKMGKGKIASQVAHATISLYKRSVQKKDHCLEAWLKWGQPKMVLKVTQDCENALVKVYEDAINNNLNACKVHDAGETQVNSGTLTVVGIGPNKKEDVDRITGQFKLL